MSKYLVPVCNTTESGPPSRRRLCVYAKDGLFFGVLFGVFLEELVLNVAGNEFVA